MQVFKLCLRVLKKNIPSLLIYVVIFLAISLIMALAHTNEQEDALFSPSKSNIAFQRRRDSTGAGAEGGAWESRQFCRAA